MLLRKSTVLNVKFNDIYITSTLHAQGRSARPHPHPPVEKAQPIKKLPPIERKFVLYNDGKPGRPERNRPPTVPTAVQIAKPSTANPAQRAGVVLIRAKIALAQPRIILDHAKVILKHAKIVLTHPPMILDHAGVVLERAKIVLAHPPMILDRAGAVLERAKVL